MGKNKGYRFFNKEYLSDLLKINLELKEVEDKVFGKVIQVSPRTAYRFCLTTNSYYLIDKYGLRLFGRFRTFNHRNHSLNQGLFLLETKGDKIINSSLSQKLYKEYPFIFSGDKRLIFVESFETSDEIERIYKKIIENNGDIFS